MKFPLLAPLLVYLTLCAATRAETPISGRPIDSEHLTRITFGSYSHWLQPWRGYLETMPASHFLDGLGIVLNTHRGEDAQQILRMCADNGIRHARIEIGWGNLDYDDETRLRNANAAVERLLACKSNGIRPLILLNGHHGAPCPLKRLSRTVTADAEAGARTVVLDNTAGLILHHSGLDNSKKYVAAERLITQIEGNQVTLSKPLAERIAAGTVVRMSTLKYAPFGNAADAEGATTLEGWKHYTRTIADFVATTLGTKGSDDLGFDLEIWNEMSSRFEFYSSEPLLRSPPLTRSI